MTEAFTRLASSKKVIQFLDRSIELFFSPDYPFLTYFGLDYSGSELLNIKLYVHAYKKISREQLRKFFPHSEFIESYYDQFEEKKYSLISSDYKHEHELNNMGTLFKYKVDNRDNDSWTFFVRLKTYLHSPILNFKLINEEKHVLDNYFSCEIKSGHPFYKRYYPILDQENREFILSRFKMENIDPGSIGNMEYLEYDNREKIAISFKGNQILNYIEEPIKDLNKFISENYRFSPMGVGKCLKTNVNSIYYIDADGGNFFKDSYTLLKLREILGRGII